MKFDASIQARDLNQLPTLVRAAEVIGFDALWSHETQYDPFLPLALISEHSETLSFGTSVAIAFARSPATVAYSAWDLARASRGRFILGLGTQVRPHIERRFGMSWPDSPVGRLREFVHAIQALWRTWQTGERLNFRGEHYKLTLMTPFFNPGPIEHADIPIYIAGVNVGLCRLAGEIADGFIAHPYHSARYLREVVRPAIEQGASHSGKNTNQIALTTSVMVSTGSEESAFLRSQIAFYASTPTYRPVMALHGWGEIADQLQVLSRKKAWDEMPALIDDEMLDTFAISASSSDLAEAIKHRYQGLVDRLSIYRPFLPGEEDEFWKELASTLHEK
jgi:probable F420-dependent oxidoreductase